MPRPWLRPVRLLGALLALAGCASAAPPEATQPRPGVPATPLAQADFDAYLEAARAHIERHGTNGVGPLAEDVVLDRAPFALAPDPTCPQPVRRGALLIHDLGGTPFEMRDLGRRLAAACFHVRAILLPGHGTAPGDLAGSAAGRWDGAVARGRGSFKNGAESVVLVGFGLGGTLAIRESRRPQGRPPVEALVLIAPRMASPSPWSGLNRLLAREPVPVRFQPGFVDPVRYGVLPENAERAAQQLARETANAADPFDLPVLLVQSADDGVADPAAGWAWFCERLLGPRRQIWYAKDNVRPGACPFVAARASDAWPGVLGFSHAGLPIDPANPRLGMAGGTPHDCDHYGLERSREWLLCADPASAARSDLRFGAARDAKASPGIVRRLGWNPDFDHMANDIVAFLGTAAPR